MSKKDQLLEQGVSKRPKFLEQRLDAEQRAPSDADYQGDTLYISPEDFAKLSPGMQRYWE